MNNEIPVYVYIFLSQNFCTLQSVACPVILSDNNQETGTLGDIFFPPPSL